jgi:hypothetical protein
MTRGKKEHEAMLYEFYSVGKGGDKIEHIGTSNSYCVGRHRTIVSMMNKLAANNVVSDEEQITPIYLHYKGDPYSAKHGECCMLFIQVHGRLITIGIRVLEEKCVSLKEFDCRRTFTEIYKYNRGQIPIAE